MCSTFEEYRTHSQDLIKRFVEKDQNESTARKQRVDQLERSSLLKHRKPKHKNTIPFSLTDKPLLPDIKKIIKRHWHILSIDSSFKEIFNNLQTMIAFHKNTSLKQLRRTNTIRNNQNFSHFFQFFSQISYTKFFTNSNHRSLYPMLHQSTTLLPTSFQNNNIYKH